MGEATLRTIPGIKLKGPGGVTITVDGNTLEKIRQSVQTWQQLPDDQKSGDKAIAILVANGVFDGTNFPNQSFQESVANYFDGLGYKEAATKVRSYPPLNQQ
jgi:hypothetical protein